MSAQDNISGEQFKGHISFNRWKGKAFRIAKTPSGVATDMKTGKVLPDDPERYSIVTPENHDAWHNWPDAPKEHQIRAKKDWKSIMADPEAGYKVEQIRRSIVKGAKNAK